MPRTRPHHRVRALAGATLCSALMAAGLLAPGVGGSSAAEAPVPGVSPGQGRTVVVTDEVRTRRRYAIAATAPEVVATASTFDLVGTATTATRRGRFERPVVLAERRGRTWVGLQRVRTSSYGEFTFSIAAGDSERSRVLRVEAPAYRGLRPARTAPLVVAVTAPAADPTGPSDPASEPAPDPGTAPAPDPTPVDPPVDPTPGYDDPELLPAGYVGQGSATDWSYLFSGGGRWNPCQVLRWAYNPAGEGYPALADMQRAMAKISGASGLRFAYAGATSWRYLGTINDRAFPSDRADIVIGWADASELPGLAGNVVGIGGGSGSTVSGSDVRVRITRGFLTLDNGHVLPGGFDQSGWGQISLHEILHALGLGHAAESVQVMYGTAHRGNTRFGAGDLTGMQRVGASPGCLP